MSRSTSWDIVFSHANSLRVSPALGGGGTRKSLPEEITQVFHEPAFGSICPALSWARALKTSTRTKNVRSVITLLIATFLQTFGPAPNQGVVVREVAFFIGAFSKVLFRRSMKCGTSLTSARKGQVTNLP